MNPSLTPRATAPEPILYDDVRTRKRSAPGVCWAAVFAGLSAALALQVLFMLLGAGLGFAIYNPLTDNDPITELGAGAVIIQGISAVLSLWLGGWVAGRFTPAGIRASGWLHGFVVWSAATVAGVLLVGAGAGWVLGDLSKLVGGGLSLAAKPAAALASGTTDLAEDALKQSGDTVTSFVDEAMGNRASGLKPNTTVRAKREVGMALARLFSPLSQADPAANRGAAVKALVDHAGMNEADAERAITDWTASFERLKADLAAAKAEAEIKARAAAEKAANALAIFSLCYFVGFVLGAVAASYGGNTGAAFARRCEARTDLPEDPRLATASPRAAV